MAPLVGISLADPRHGEVAAGEIYGMLDDQTEAVLGVSHSSTKRLELIQERVAAQTANTVRLLGLRMSHDTGWGLVSARAYRNHAGVAVPMEIIPGGVKIHNAVVVAAIEALIRAGNSNTVRVGIASFATTASRVDPAMPEQRVTMSMQSAACGRAS